MVCIDSNIVNYSPYPDKLWLRKWLSWQSLATSIICKIEVIGYHQITNAEIRLANHFFSFCRILKLTNSIVDLSILLWQQRSISMGDAIIAASALSDDLSLLTANVLDFKHIESLNLMGLEEMKKI